MKRNFVIRDAVAVDASEMYADLHNDFDLSEVSIFFGNRQVVLRFERYAGASSKTSPESVILEVSDVDFLSVSADALGVMNRDVVEIGYKSPGDFDHDWLITEGKSEEEDHLFIRLTGDGFIRVHGDAAMVSVGASSA